MASGRYDMNPEAPAAQHQEDRGSGQAVINSGIGESIDLLVDYLLDNGVDRIYPLIMGEVERRVLTRALERCRGNKFQAAKLLGISRNTFRRKIQELVAGRMN